jgi:Zn finger protein HypA/HybF involved in hydrogenase expression
MRYKHTKEKLEIAIKKSLSIAGVCRELEMKACGGNYKTLYSKIREWNIDTSHFTGAAWNQGSKFKPFGKKYNLCDVLIKNSPYKTTNSLKKRLFDEKIKTKECEECGINEWNGKSITLELDHINGDNTDNRIENLKILCPNCHSQTHTFRNKKRFQ